MRCAICNQELHNATEPIVATTTGDFVHISCADREASRTYRWRTFWVAISALLALSLLGLVFQANLRGTALLALLVLLVAVHVRLNERWWRVTMLVLWRRARAGAR